MATMWFGLEPIAQAGRTLPCWELAESEARIMLTLDKDFWQIAVQRRVPLEQSGVVLFRVHPATAANLGPLVRSFVEANRAWAGHISIVGADGIQMLATRAR
jgi:predicted nuclease of predicted toxin-antitoxin system